MWWCRRAAIRAAIRAALGDLHIGGTREAVLSGTCAGRLRYQSQRGRSAMVLASRSSRM